MYSIVFFNFIFFYSGRKLFSKRKDVFTQMVLKVRKEAVARPTPNTKSKERL